ncbi:MAG: STAS domain-containing protein [Phycisphaerae bacterium]|jgi:anti-sigma B factor antagonist|nr:STAS domain-containing protein [Phycisphaerae bacterium]MDP7290506.1 STAS domain-containing protein [Phycisphaerae bacterium]
MEFYEHEIDNDVLIIAADGGIDRNTSKEFVERIIELVEGGVTKIIVDCTKLTYISSWGLGVLLRLHKQAKTAGGEVKIANVHSRIVELLKLTRLNKVFGLYPDVNRARLDFRPKPGTAGGQ